MSSSGVDWAVDKASLRVPRFRRPGGDFTRAGINEELLPQL